MATIIPRFQGFEEPTDTDNANRFYKKIEKRKRKQKDLSNKIAKIEDEGQVNGDEKHESDGNEKAPKKKRADKLVNSNTVKDSNEKDGNLFVLGGHQFQKQKAQWKLPNWLKNPTVISTDLSNLKVTPDDIKELSPRLKNCLKQNIKHFLPVQAEVIPWLLRNSRTKTHAKAKPSRDICVSAPTGSGKTLAYVLPIINCLEKRIVPEIRALVIVPVQELARQVAKVFLQYTEGTNLKVLVSTGGSTSFKTEQFNLVKRSNGIEESYESLVDILVTTPGRLVEHLFKTKGFSLKYLKYIVIDEADRVIDNIQDNWLYHLERHLLAEDNKWPHFLNLNVYNTKGDAPQKLLYSATLSQNPEKLHQLNLFQPKLFTSIISTSGNDGEEDDLVVKKGEFIGKFTTPAELEEFYVTVIDALKPLAVCKFLEMGWKKILCFTKSGENAHTLSNLLTILQPQLVIKELSSNLNRNTRDQTLESFTKGSIDMLVCSDVVARGVDIPGVQYVISYDPPKFIKGYIHRAGRTGRAGTKGTAVTLANANQTASFLSKLTQVGKTNVQEMKIDEEIYKRRQKEYQNALQQLQNLKENEKEAKVKKMKNNKNGPKRKRKWNKGSVNPV